MTTTPEPFDTGEVLSIWATISARRTSYDSLIWQTPALGLAAQAFLLTLALGSDTSALGRAMSAGLSLALSVMVIQLLLKHRQGEFLDALALERIEKRLDFEGRVGALPHGHPSARNTDDEQDRAANELRALAPWPRRFWKMSSVRLWVTGQWVFAGVAFFVIVLVLTGHSGLLA